VSTQDPHQRENRDLTPPRGLLAAGAIVATAFVAVMARPYLQDPASRAVDERVLRDATGAYRWESNGFLYLQPWKEFSGFDKPSQLVAFDEAGDVRVLYPDGRDRFVAGPGVAVTTSIESRIAFERDAGGAITGLTWQRGDAAPRRARRTDTERREDVQFPSGDLRLTGTLLTPAARGTHPAIILVHGSGPEDRDHVLPWARFLVRRGIAVLGYDKRGVGGSTGDWNMASFEDLAGDVVAAFAYLRTRADVDPAQIGLLGISQAGWIMPLAATRARELAFLISISGGAVTPAATTLDQAANEMKARGMKPQTIDDILAIMKLQYRFAQTGEGWSEYAAARDQLAARLGQPPPTMPGTPDHPAWQSIRRFYFFDPAPVLRQIRVPMLAIFGERDNNILADKNSAALEAALKAGGHPDYTLRVLARANHGLFEAASGSNAEGPTLQRFVPEYFTTVEEWLAKRIRH
jgi:dienelactone hydrolase